MFWVTKSVFAAYDGRDPWTLEKLSGFDRTLASINAAVEFAQLVMIVGGIYNSFMSPCGSFSIFRTCFVGDTKVLVARLPHGSTAAMAGAGAEQPDDMSLGSACLLIGLGCAVTAFAVGNRPLAEPKRRRRKWNVSMIDDLFAGDDSLNLLDDHPTPESQNRRAAGRQPSVEIAEVDSVQSPVFSESQSFSPDASAATTLLVPVDAAPRAGGQSAG